MEINDLIKVIVTKVEPGYVLVNYCGQETTLQQTELTWNAGPVYPNEFVKEGEEITVRVIAKDGERFSPSLKHVNENPWEKPPEIGKFYQSPVMMVTEYGYYINIEYYCNALLTMEHSQSPHSLGDLVDVKVIEVNVEKHTVSLSEISGNKL